MYQADKVFRYVFPDGGEVCIGADCEQRNCSWTQWGAWSLCSRSCGVGQQQRVRTFLSPGTNGSWCEDILGGNMEHRFCNIKPCRGQPVRVVCKVINIGSPSVLLKCVVILFRHFKFVCTNNCITIKHV